MAGIDANERSVDGFIHLFRRQGLAVDRIEPNGIFSRRQQLYRPDAIAADRLQQFICPAIPGLEFLLDAVADILGIRQ